MQVILVVAGVVMGLIGVGLVGLIGFIVGFLIAEKDESLINWMQARDKRKQDVKEEKRLERQTAAAIKALKKGL